MTKVNVTLRHNARRYALQALYQWQITSQDIANIEIEFHQHQRMDKVDMAYFHELVHKIPERLDEIEQRKHKGRRLEVVLSAIVMGSGRLYSTSIEWKECDESVDVEFLCVRTGHTRNLAVLRAAHALEDVAPRPRAARKKK